MTSLFFTSSLLLPSLHRSTAPLQVQSQRYRKPANHYSLKRLSISTIPSLRSFCSSQPIEGPVSVVDFEELLEKDWSFLESETLNSDREANLDRIIAAGEVGEASRVLVSIGSEEFVDCLVGSCPLGFLLVVHDSLFVLAGIKERHDRVKCWQGEIVYVPDKWAPFDVVFLWFLPALPFELDQILGALARVCSSGARVVISHPQGREVLDKQRKEYPDVVISDLPDKITLEKVATNHSFVLTEYVDQHGFYLAIFRFCKADL